MDNKLFHLLFLARVFDLLAGFLHVFTDALHRVAACEYKRYGSCEDEREFLHFVTPNLVPVIPAKAGTRTGKIFTKTTIRRSDWIPARRFIPAQAGTGMTA
jgi:hypothetical protein